jgi:hypothetical protein
MSEISPLLEEDYGEAVYDIIDNFRVDPNLPTIKNIDRAFYAFALLAMGEDILSSILKDIQDRVSMKRAKKSGYNDTLASLLGLIHTRMDIIMEQVDPDAFKFHERDRGNILETLDFSKKLLLNDRFDWKVNRGIQESSDTLGFKNI